MPEDTTKEIQLKREICSQCWYQHERVTYNVNGRCDRCGGTDWIDAGITQEDAIDATLQELHEIFEDEPPGMWEHADYSGGDPNEQSHSAREKVQQQLKEMKEKKYPNPLRKTGFFKD